MTDEILIEEMAGAITGQPDPYAAARAALAVAKKELFERAAREAENECWKAEAHPESIYGSTCLKIAARIRSLADE